MMIAFTLVATSDIVIFNLVLYLQIKDFFNQNSNF
jgi:hypothetical protein